MVTQKALGLEPEKNKARSPAVAEMFRLGLGTLKKRWLALVTVVSTIFGLGMLGIFFLPSDYSSTARIRIDPSQNPLAGRPLHANALATESIATEISRIRSIDIATQVVTELGLIQDPSFHRIVAEEGSITTHSAEERARIIAEALLQNLTVRREDQTYILSVTFSGRSASQTADIANAFARLYLVAAVQSDLGRAQRQADSYRLRMEAVGAEARAADAAVADYRANAGLTRPQVRGEGEGNSQQEIYRLSDPRIGPLSTNLAQARSSAAAARAVASSARRQIAAGNIEGVVQVRESRVITQLRRQRAQIMSDAAQIQARYGSQHPEMSRIGNQVSAINLQIKDEAERIVASLEANALAAEARVASLDAAINTLQSERGEALRAEVTASSLERAATDRHAAYDAVSRGYVDSIQATQNNVPQASVIQQATTPPFPTSPNKQLLAALALVVSLVAGVGTIALQESLASGLRTIDDIEAQFGVPVLTAIPSVRQNSPADLLLTAPSSQYAEAFRIARAALTASSATQNLRVIAITSAVPGEGKSTVALSFARIFAIARKRTLVIDCDVRRGSLFDITASNGPEVGLVEVLRGEAQVNEAIATGELEGLDHLFVLKPYFSSEDLFAGDRMKGVLDSLRPHYDMIVLDLPPMVGLADGRYLAALADAVLLVVRWDETSVQAVDSALATLRLDGVEPAGAIYSQVAMRAGIFESLRARLSRKR